MFQKAIRLFLSLLFAIGFSSCILTAKEVGPKKPFVAVTSCDLTWIVQAIAQEKADVISLVPFSKSPYIFDVEKASPLFPDTEVFIYHGWEKLLSGNAASYFVSSDSKEAKLKTSGDFMIPYINARAAMEITEILAATFPSDKKYFEKNCLEYVYKIEFLKEQLLKKRPYFENKNVVCQKNLTDFFEYLGFNVVLSFTDKDINSEAFIKKLKSLNEHGSIYFIADNIEISDTLALKTAEKTGIKHIAVYNFPQKGYVDTVNYNIKIIEEALSEDLK